MLVLDGGRGFGQLVGERATDLALDAAATHAVSAVAARNAGHIGRLGAYTERIAEAGMVGVLLVNFQGGDPLVARSVRSSAGFPTTRSRSGFPVPPCSTSR